MSTTNQIKDLENQLQDLYSSRHAEQYADRLDHSAIAQIDLRIKTITDALNSIDPVRVVKIERERKEYEVHLAKVEADRNAVLKRKEEIETKLKSAFQIAILFPARLTFKDEYENKIIRLVQNKAPYVKFSLVCLSKNDYYGFFNFEDLYHKYPEVGSSGYSSNNYVAKRFLSDYKGWWATTSKMLSDVKPDAVVVIADPNNETDKPFLQFVENVLKKYKITVVKHISL